MTQSKKKIKGIIEAKNLAIDDKIELLTKHKYHQMIHKPVWIKTEKRELEETRNAIRSQRKLAEERRERERKELRRLGRGI
jgi:trehalose/maltose hydrolase-like predicted phosphorylase